MRCYFLLLAVVFCTAELACVCDGTTQPCVDSSACEANVDCMCSIVEPQVVLSTESPGLSDGKFAGILIGFVFALFAIVALTVFWNRYRQRQRYTPTK